MSVFHQNDPPYNDDFIQEMLTPAFSLYNEVKVAERSNQFNLLSSVPVLSELRNDIQENGGSVTQSSGQLTLSTGTATGDEAILQTQERGRYGPGKEAEFGNAVRRPSAPTGTQEWKAGGFDGSDGPFFGEDSNGVYVARMKGGSIEGGKTYQEDWNLDTLDGARDGDNPSGAELDLSKGVVLRNNFTLYNHGTFVWSIQVTDPDDGYSKFIPVHVESPDGASVNQQNLPSRVEVTNGGSSTSQFDLYVSDRQFSTWGQNDNVPSRVNGVARLNQSISTADTWIPLVSYKRRSGFDEVDVRPAQFTVGTDTDMRLAIFLGSDLNADANFSIPENTSASETAIEVDNEATGFDTVGDQRYITAMVSGGPGNSTENVGKEVDFNLPAEKIVTLAANVPASATVTSSIQVGEDF